MEQRIEKLTSLLGNVETDYPRRWLAIKLLESDEEITKLIERLDKKIVQAGRDLAEELERFTESLAAWS